MKIRYYIVMLVISTRCLSAQAQTIKVGQQVPNVTLFPLSNYKNKSAVISDFKGKLLVLDFWATWCSPCITIIPQMDSLQKKFAGKVQFLPVAYQSKKEVDIFLGKLEKQQGIKETLPMLTGDTILARLFVHRTLPHLVWIGTDGIVKAITEGDALNSEFINRLLAGKDPGVRMKIDEIADYDREQPLLVTTPGESFAVTGYIPGIGGGSYNNTMIPGNGQDRRITARNLPLPGLYRLAFSKLLRKQTILDVSDPETMDPSKELTGGAYEDWAKQGHTYCMELIIPDSLRNDAYKILQEKLKAYFPNYQASLDMRYVKCLALVRTSDIDKMKTSGGTASVEMDAFGAKFKNCYIRTFISRMQLPLQNNPLPLYDGTGYSGMVDLELSGKINDIANLNGQLEKYGLRFEEKFADIEMLVIRETKKN